MHCNVTSDKAIQKETSSRELGISVSLFLENSFLRLGFWIIPTSNMLSPSILDGWSRSPSCGGKIWKDTVSSELGGARNNVSSIQYSWKWAQSDRRVMLELGDLRSSSWLGRNSDWITRNKDGHCTSKQDELVHCNGSGYIKILVVLEPARSDGRLPLFRCCE